MPIVTAAAGWPFAFRPQIGVIAMTHAMKVNTGRDSGYDDTIRRDATPPQGSADHDDNAIPHSYPLERRENGRHTISGRATALISSADPLDGHKRISSLQLLNMSDGGIGALAQEPLEPGSHITIFFPPHGPEKGMDLPGHIVRQAPRDHGYEIGIRFDQRLAA